MIKSGVIACRSKSLQYNTLIGGIAKLGGVGANAPILTTQDLADKLNINVSRIKRFKVEGDNVKCHIKGNYILKAFGDSDVENANQNITYYHDYAGLVTTLSDYTFRKCSNFKEFTFSKNLTTIYDSVFSETDIEHVDFSYLKNNVSGRWSNMFSYCYNLKSIDFGELTLINLDSSTNSLQLLRGCGALENVINLKIDRYNNTFRDAGSELYESFYNEYVKEMEVFSFSHLCKIENIELPNCELMISDNFHRGNVSQSYLKTLILPKVEFIGNQSLDRGNNFTRNVDLELLDIRSCKYFYGENFLNAMKSGGVIKVHEFMRTGTDGDAHPELYYLKNERNVIVEFYDNNGNYVSTL